MIVDTVTWAGNSVDDTTISFTGALSGVTPDLVIVKRDASVVPVWSSDTMTTGESAYFANSLANATGLIKSLISGGFTVGTASEVNTTSGTYYAIGFYDDGGGDFATFTHTGNATDDRALDTIGFQPNFVVIKRDGTNNAVAKFEEQTTDTSYIFETSAAITNGIQLFRSLGVELGTRSRVNSSGPYHGFAFKNVDGFCDSHTYVGDGTDSRSISVQGTTFTPELVIVKRSGASEFQVSFDISTDATFQFDSGGATAANMIQARNSTGFEVGTSSRVNAVGGDTYHYLALKSNPLATPETEDQTPGTGFTELLDDWIDSGSYVNSLHTEWRIDNDTTVDSSSATAWPIGGIAVEIKKATSAVSSNLTGTATPYIGDTDIVAGGKTLVLQLSNDTWAAAGTGPIGSTADTQALIDGITSAQVEAAGWNAEVRDKEVTTAVVRTSNTVATITLTASPSYVITANENITVTIPAATLVTSASAVVASPLLLVTYEQFEANSDVNWLNPPTLPARTGALSYDTATNVLIEFETIDAEAVDALYFVDCTTVTIENCLISNVGDRGINFLRTSGITVRNCKIIHTNNNGTANEGQGIYLTDCGDDVLIEGNWFEDVAAGIRISACSDQDNYVVRGNYCKNPTRPPAGGSQGQFIQMTYCAYMTNTSITDNVCNGDSTAEIEDWMNLFDTGGTAASPIMITGNKIQGGGLSNSGGGILCVDNATTKDRGYVTVSNNRLVDPGQYGIALTGGHNVVVTNNDVFAAVDAPNLTTANVGLYLWRQSAVQGNFYSCTVGSNNVLWYSGSTGTTFKNGKWFPTTGSDGLAPNHGTVAEGNVNPTSWATNDFDHTAWDAASGQQGYTDLPVPSAWVYYPPS